jgi:HSP20 family molecular chaperone IbpA
MKNLLLSPLEKKLYDSTEKLTAFANSIWKSSVNIFDSVVSKLQIESEENTFGVTMHIHVPGATKDEISITHDNNVLNVSCTRKEDSIGVDSFEREFSLEELDENTIVSSLKDGILSIQINKLVPVESSASSRKTVPIS